MRIEIDLYEIDCLNFQSLGIGTISIGINKTKFENLKIPFWHLFPVCVIGQRQLYELSLSMQTPLLRQANVLFTVTQSSTFTSQFLPVYPLGQVHVYDAS